jgi:hypothetical protein
MTEGRSAVLIFRDSSAGTNAEQKTDVEIIK